MLFSFVKQRIALQLRQLWRVVLLNRRVLGCVDVGGRRLVGGGEYETILNHLSVLAKRGLSLDLVDCEVQVVGALGWDRHFGLVVRQVNLNL